MSFKWHRSQWGKVSCWHHKTSNILISIGSGNDFAPDKQRVTNWTSADLLTFWRLGANVSEFWINIQVLSLINAFENGAYKWQIFCLGLNESMTWTYITYGILNIETRIYYGKIPVPQYAFWYRGVASWSPKFVVFLAVGFHNSGDDKYPCKNEHHWSDVFVITTEVNLSQPTVGWWIVFDAALKSDSSPSLSFQFVWRISPSQRSTRLKLMIWNNINSGFNSHLQYRVYWRNTFYDS